MVCGPSRTMGTCISHSPAETEALGETWGRAAKAGMIIALTGDLGAGKTQLVKGLARGLGISERVHSPTFSLVNIYLGGRLTLYHLDLYRLETRDQIIAAGLEEYLISAEITVVEWAEKWIKAPRSRGEGQSGRALAGATANSPLPIAAPALRWVQIETLNETKRRITYEDISA